MESALAAILAGGRGKRMGILCQNRAKPSLSFAGKNCVIDYTLSNCIHSKINDIIILTDYLRSDMADYLNDWVEMNGNSKKMHIIEPGNGSYLGTADAVYQNIEYLERNNDDLVIVLAGDHVYEMDYQKMLDFHRQTGADITVGIVSVPIEQAYRFGIVTIDSNKRIVNFIEKPEFPESNLVSMGIYVFNKHILIERLVEDALTPHSPHDFGHAIIPRMIRTDNVAGYEFEGYWRDIGTTEAYYTSNMEVLGPGPLFNANNDWPVLTRFDHLASPVISRQGNVHNSVISPGCVIKGRIENSILSPNVYVEEEAEVRNSLIMSDCYIGYHSVVDHCILDVDVNVDKFCYLGFEGGSVADSWKVTILGEGVTVPSHTAICRNCKVLPFVGPDDFSGKVVPSNTILSQKQMSRPLQKYERGVLSHVS